LVPYPDGKPGTDRGIPLAKKKSEDKAVPGVEKSNMLGPKLVPKRVMVEAPCVSTRLGPYSKTAGVS
jgi:hypothetical protein